MDQFEIKMNKAFQKLAMDIMPSKELLKEQKRCADQVSQIIFLHFSQKMQSIR